MCCFRRSQAEFQWCYTHFWAIYCNRLDKMDSDCFAGAYSLLLSVHETQGNKITIPWWSEIKIWFRISFVCSFIIELINTWISINSRLTLKAAWLKLQQRTYKQYFWRENSNFSLALFIMQNWCTFTWSLLALNISMRHRRCLDIFHILTYMSHCRSSESHWF